MPGVGGAVGLSLFGRELELKQLAELINGVRDRGGALFLSGEAGIGKSALLAEAGSLAATAGLAGAADQRGRVRGASAARRAAPDLYPIRSGVEPFPRRSATPSRPRWV